MIKDKKQKQNLFPAASDMVLFFICDVSESVLACKDKRTEEQIWVYPYLYLTFPHKSSNIKVT